MFNHLVWVVNVQTSKVILFYLNLTVQCDKLSLLPCLNMFGQQFTQGNCCIDSPV